MTKDEVEKFVDDMIDNFDEDKLMVDPPSGWRYGFPKPYFKIAIGDQQELHDWLVKNGYPRKEIESMPNCFPVRMWIQRS